MSSDSEACRAGGLLSVCVISSFVVTQVGLYHDQQTEDGGSSKENRNIYSESMPRRVGSFYRGWFSHTDISGCASLSLTALLRSRHQFRFKHHSTAFYSFLTNQIFSYLKPLSVHLNVIIGYFKYYIDIREFFGYNHSLD